jgi:hypothetical protein
MVPLRRAATGFGRPAFTSDWVPMMPRVRRERAGPQHQLGARHAGGARDAHGAVLVEAARVEHHHVGLRVDQRLHLLRRQRGRVPLVLDQFAEGLARHVDIAEQLAAGRSPAVEPACERVHVGVAQRCEALGRGGHAVDTVLFAVQHDPRVAPWNAPRRVAFDQVERQVRGPQRVDLRVGVFLAQVDERDLVAGEQVPADIGEGEGRESHAWRSSAERSHRLGSRAFE